MTKKQSKKKLPAAAPDQELQRLRELGDPRAALAAAKQHQESAHAFEELAIRMALEAEGWNLRRAAKVLGMSHQAIQSMTAHGRRHATIGAELAAMRHAMGNPVGRPPENGNE